MQKRRCPNRAEGQCSWVRPGQKRRSTGVIRWSRWGPGRMGRMPAQRSFISVFAENNGLRHYARSGQPLTLSGPLRQRRLDLLCFHDSHGIDLNCSRTTSQRPWPCLG